MESTIKKVCAHCGVELSEEIAVNDKLYCNDCIEELFEVCDDCGEYSAKSDITTVSGGNSICQNCLDENYTKCEDCDEYVKNEDITLIDGQDICSDCRDENYFTCDRCGEIHDNDYGTGVGDEYWCDDCADNYSNTCYDCDRRFPLNDLVEIDGENVCTSCRDSGDYYICEDCGETHHSDNMRWIDEEPYCDECADRHDNEDEDDDDGEAIGNYHSHSYNRLTFYGETNNNAVPYLGVELEVDAENRVDRSRSALEMKACLNGDGQFVYMEGDGSLNYGFEAITHPATCEYHMSKASDYEKAFKSAIANNLRSHQTSTCGLHVHFNRDFYGESEADRDAGITRLLYLTEKFWDELTKFSRRRISNLQRWANKYNKEPREIVADMKRHNVGRYYAVNLTNRATIEFRMFRGTLKLNTYLATLQLVNNLVIASKYVTEPEKLQALPWDYFINSEELTAYWEQVKERVVR